MDTNNSNNNNNHNHQDYCQVCGSGFGRCGACGNMCGWNNKHIIRWVIGIIIITWIFCIGVKFGEFKASMANSGFGGHLYTRGMPMMNSVGWSGASDQVFFTQAAAPTTVTSGAVKIIKQ